MRLFLYDVFTSAAAPLVCTRLMLSRRYRTLLKRFYPEVPDFRGSPVWFQACSLGEVNVAKPILDAVCKRLPDDDCEMLLTVSTLAGRTAAESAKLPAKITWCPFDQRQIVTRFVKTVQPRALILVETEVWPNLVRCTADLGIPVAIINGRISDKHLPRYQRFSGWLKPVFGRISLACMQNEEYAERIVELGVPRSNVRVTGNTKFDGVALDVNRDEVRDLREACGIREDASVLVFGSTRPGDERLAAECWNILKNEFPELILVLVPRHTERTEEVMAFFSNEKILLRSRLKQGAKPAGERVLIVDVMGELVKFYAMAALAVIGGSFYPGVNGHNPLESAALGIPTVFGPYMRNFIDPARALISAGGARQVKSPDDLAEVLVGLLSDSAERARLATRGREAVLANRGAIERTLDAIFPLLERGVG